MDRVEIPGIQIESEVGRGARTVVYRAVRKNRTFVVKVCRDTDTDADAVYTQFRREGAYMACLHHPALAAVIEVGAAAPSGGRPARPYIIMEYVEGRTLGSVIADERLTEDRIIAIGRSLARALAEVHSHGFVHRDVKPHNIIITPHDAVKLIDFGFATRTDESNENEAVGTFLYSAPEQTGMLKRPVDARADLYAVGVVLFECATGTRPFHSPDLAELMRQHAVTRPPAVRDLNPAISLALEAVVDKLLSKDPDDRYPSAADLAADLERLESLDEAFRIGHAVRLAEGGEQPMERPLVGRERELERLGQAWNLACQGLGGVAVIEGAIGSGKSRLLREMCLRAQSDEGLIVTAACAQGDVPLAALKPALDACAGGEALLPLLCKLSPALAHLSDERPEEEPEGFDPYFEAVADLLARTAASRGPMLLALDDVGWIDDTSWQVLRRLAARLDGLPLLLVVSRRTDLESRDLTAPRTSRVHLGPLDEDAVARLVTQQLGGHAIDRQVVREIADISLGTPLAITECLRGLLDGGWIRPSWGAWIVEPEGLQRLRFPSGVLQLVEERLRRMDDTVRRVLGAASVLGRRFARPLLQAIVDAEPEEVHRALGEGVIAHVLTRVDAERCAFVHDRIHEAVVRELDDDERRRLHRRVAEVLEASGAARDDRVFSLARHHIRGALGPSAAAAAACVAAARQAVRACADEDAYEYFTQAVRLSEEGTAAFEETFGDVCKRSGRMREAVDHYEAALRALDAAARLQRASLHCKLSQVHVAGSDTASAGRDLDAGFEAIGEVSPRESLGQIASASLHGTRGLLAMRRPPASARMADEERRRLQILGLLYHTAGHLAYLDNQPLRLWEVVMQLLDVGQRLGPSNALVRAYCGYAASLATLGRVSASSRVAARAVAVAEGVDDARIVAHARVLEVLTRHIAGLPQEAEALGQACLDTHGRWMESADHEILSADMTYNLMARGYLHRAWSWLQIGVRGGQRKAGLTDGQDLVLTLMGAALHASMGRRTAAEEALQQARRLIDAAPDSTVRHSLLMQYRLWTEHETGERATATLEAHGQRRFPLLLTPHHLRLHYVMAGYVHLYAGLEGTGVLRALGGAIAELGKAARGAAYEGHRRVLQAGLDLLRGHGERALATLTRAETLAAAVDSPWILFEAAQVRASVYERRGDEAGARLHARFACAVAAENGWRLRAQRIQQRFGLDVAGFGETGSLSQTVGMQTASRSMRGLRSLDALLQVSLAAAGALDPHEQARAALDEIVQILGAERAFLFLCEQGDEGVEKLALMAGRDQHKTTIAELTGYSSTVVEQVRQRRRPLVVSGTDEGAVLGSQSAVVHDLRSILCAPLMMRERLVGVVYLDSRVARGVFSGDDVQILTALGNHIAIALETARAAQLEIDVQTEQRERVLAEQMRDLSSTLMRTLDMAEVLDRLLESLKQTVGLDAGRAWLKRQDRWICVAARPALTEREIADEPPAEGDEAAWLDAVAAGGDGALDAGPGDVSTGSEVNARGPASSSETPATKRAASSLYGTRLGLPLTAREEVVAVLRLSRAERYETHEADLAMTFASQAGFAIENARLFTEVRRLATTDVLTGIFNRRHFFTTAEAAFQHALDSHAAVCAIMLDIDHFKRVNDGHGHAAGDVVIQTVAERCRQQLRKTDIFGRYGGEEFVLLLLGNRDAASRTAMRLLTAIRQTPVTWEELALPITISIGVAQAEPQGETLHGLLQRADAALYRAKETGRNRVVMDSEMDEISVT